MELGLMDSRSRSAGQARQAVADRDQAIDAYDDSCIHLEHKRYFVAVKGTPLRLTKTEFRVLSCLVRGIDRIVAFDDLWRYAWSPGKSPNRKSIHVFVSRVRRKLSPFGMKIDTVVGVGCMLSHGKCCSPGQSERQV